MVGDEREAALLLRGAPADPRFARLQVVGGGAPGQQGDPLALVFGHRAHLLAHEVGAFQVVLCAQQLVEAGSLLRFEQADLHAVEQALLVLGEHGPLGHVHAGEGRNRAGGSSALSAIPFSHRRFPGS